jgi:hypothetical protein
MTLVKRLVTSRRVRVIAAMLSLFGANWYLNGVPGKEDIAAFLSILLGWVFSESNRRHDGGVASSQRFILTMLSQVGLILVKKFSVPIPPDMLQAGAVTVAGWLVGEGLRKHEDGEEAAEEAAE